MEQRFNYGLNAKLNDFAQKFGINRSSMPEDKFFESFSNYVIISNLLEEDFENINKISTGKAQGIDGIGIIINNKLITDDSDLDKIGESERLQINLCFIQSTTIGSYDHKKFQSFIDEVVNFLIGKNRIEPFSDLILDRIFNEENDYLDRLKETPKIFIYFSSGCTNHTLNPAAIEAESKKIKERADLQHKFILDGIYFLQENDLCKNYDQIQKFLEVPIRFHKSKQLEEKNDVKFSLIASIKFGELRKLIEKDGILREQLFIENPRSVIENSIVNDKIMETLTSATFRDYFIFLNNGLTILCDEIRRHEVKEDVFYLTFPRIINGCQTTHMLFNYHESNPIIDELEVFVKVIATQNKDLKNRIIFATNNQNSIDKDLQALNEFHTKLEDYFKGRDKLDLYYERLRGQHSKVTPPYKKINIENMAKVYISVVLKLPHEMKSNAVKKIEKYQNSGAIFRGDNLADYYYCAILYYYLNRFVANNIITLRTQTMDMHLLLTCDLQLKKSGLKSTEGKIDKLEDNKFAEEIFNAAIIEINSQQYLFDRRGFYSGPKTKKLIDHFN